MHCEINVSKNGQHFFATDERSLPNEEKAKEVYKELVRAFPPELGYTIDVTKWSLSGTVVHLEGE